MSFKRIVFLIATLQWYRINHAFSATKVIYLEGDVLPLEADKIMSGNLGFVAIWVTHPL